ncbi:beta-lactamase-like protein [Mycena maculata]|uniref:hydroxyacylglutathione hydrolase n=1 Tax=Mycena maculata TaxID=230809 RepID=A0AAD7NEV7_9AGAR|nr:beta-lactamase-like protein [Mycena maculata]
MLPFRRLLLSRPFSTSRATYRMKVVPVPVRTDNYAYIIYDDKDKSKAAVVDPYDVKLVTAAADDPQVKVAIVAALTTHHHNDHNGGNKTFAEKYPEAKIYAGSEEAAAVTKSSEIVNLKEKEQEFLVGNIRIKCLSTPCHTQDSICFYATDDSAPSEPGVVFTGDTLFVAGCGRFFEGTAAQMHAALTYLGTLPPATRVYNGHEYTAGSLAFGLSVDPANPALARLGEIVKAHPWSTGMTTIGDEKEWNVFMRLQDPAVKARVQEKYPNAVTDSAIMEALREMKNNFKG